MTRIACVVVTFNRLELLKKTVAASLSEDVDVCIIVNNASTDGTREWLENQSGPRLDIIHCDKNIGGAGGFHVGFARAVNTHEIDWLVCYDDDAYPAEGAVACFRDKLPGYSDAVGAVAAAVYSPSNEIVEMNRPGLRPFSSPGQSMKTVFQGRKGFHIGDNDYKSPPRPVYNASFVGLFVARYAINKVGLPRKELFIYGDDVLYSMDLADSGFTVLFDPELKFIHNCSTINRQDVAYKPMWKAYYTYRNAIEIYRRESGFIFPIIMTSKALLWVYKARHYESKREYLKIVYVSIKDGLKRDYTRTHDEVLQSFPRILGA